MLKGMIDWRKMNNVRNFLQEFVQPVRSNNSVLNDSWIFTVSKFIFHLQEELEYRTTFTFSFLIHSIFTIIIFSLHKFSNIAKKKLFVQSSRNRSNRPESFLQSYSVTDKISILNCNAYRKLIVNAKT